MYLTHPWVFSPDSSFKQVNTSREEELVILDVIMSLSKKLKDETPLGFQKY